MRNGDQPSPEEQGPATGQEAKAAGSDPLAPPDLPGISLTTPPLSRGPFSAVYRGWDRTHRRDVIVKVLQTTGDPVAADRFRREASVMAHLRHPNIVALYSFHNGNPSALIMEYVPGQTLGEIVEKHGPLTAARTAEIVEEIAAALDCVHAENVVHRDIKPSNILIPKQGPARLTDFGVAHIDTSAPLTVRGDMLGTIEYASPEQVKGTSAPDTRSDVYSLAAAAYFALAGTPPFPAADSSMQSQLSVMHQQVFSQPPPLRFHRTDLAPGIDAAVRRGLAKDPAERYPSAGQFASALRSAVLVAADAPAAVPASSPRRPYALSGAVAGIALLAGGAALVFNREQSPPASSPASPSAAPHGRAAGKSLSAPAAPAPARVAAAPAPAKAAVKPALVPSVGAKPKQMAALPPKPMPTEPKSMPTEPKSMPTEPKSMPTEPKSMPTEPKPVPVAAAPLPRTLAAPPRPAARPALSASAAHHVPAAHASPVPSAPIRVAKRSVIERPKFRRSPAVVAARQKPLPVYLASAKPSLRASTPPAPAWLSVYAKQDVLSVGGRSEAQIIPAQEVWVDGRLLPSLASGGWASVPPGKHWVAFVPAGHSGFGPSPGVWVSLAAGAHVSRRVLLPASSPLLATMRPPSSSALTAAATPVPPPAPAAAPVQVSPAPFAQSPASALVGWYTVSGWIARGPAAPTPTLVRTSAHWVKVDGTPNLALALGQWAELSAGKHTIEFQPTNGVGVGAKTWDIDLSPQAHLDQRIPLPPVDAAPE